MCVALCALAAVSLGSCEAGRLGEVALKSYAAYPPAPQRPHVVVLGNLSSNPRPTEAEVELARFLFGADPEPPLGLVKPSDQAVVGDSLLICDSGMNAVFRWAASAPGLSAWHGADRPERPTAMDIAPNGDVLVADVGRDAVYHYDASGRMHGRFALPGAALRPGGVVALDGEVWVSNAQAHRIEVFDRQTRKHRRSIGQRGVAPGSFGVPLGMARTPEGNVCVVDMLNARVQVLDGHGDVVRIIGRPGDRVGCFGRPKDVAVGPDGTVFVTDAASQRVHAFDSEGRVLLAFGAPGSGVGALSVPNGIAVSTQPPMPVAPLPAGFDATYYVLVAEQLLDPGVRIYAWQSPGEVHPPAAVTAPRAPRTQLNSETINPHWSPAHCGQCHTMDSGRARRIAMDQIDTVCLHCHNGTDARMEAHPVGRPASGSNLTMPDVWPLVDGRLGCITCHDVVRHCARDARRPRENPGMLRFHDPQAPMALCTLCHVPDETWRISPHNQVDATGAPRMETCVFCHDDGSVTASSMAHAHQPKLRGGDICLGCHTRHWDYVAEGHAGRPVPATMRGAMRSAARRMLGEGGSEDVVLLPLDDGKVACYTCHNPHAPGLFPSGSLVGMFASSDEDAAVDLRMNRTDLCLSCHPK